jgi:hypothetical protein
MHGARPAADDDKKGARQSVVGRDRKPHRLTTRSTPASPRTAASRAPRNRGGRAVIACLGGRRVRPERNVAPSDETMSGRVRGHGRGRARRPHSFQHRGRQLLTGTSRSTVLRHFGIARAGTHLWRLSTAGGRTTGGVVTVPLSRRIDAGRVGLLVGGGLLER